MTEPFVGEIRLGAFAYAPQGWAFCNGQLLAINQNQPLFALLGTQYGGDGRVNFALPDLRSRVPVHFGGSYVLGQVGGESGHALTQSELPPHNHQMVATSAAGSQSTPVGNVPAAPAKPAYVSAGPDTTMSPGLVAPTGGSLPHENMPPYLVLNFVIALQGVFPSRN
jgi:microcystin-dependent protein